MKRVLCTLSMFALSLSLTAQDASVEKSVFGIQTGLLGVWAHNETKLADQFSLRTEIGLDTGIFGGSNFDDTSFVMAPVITLEPRWYYNLDKRLSKSKNISGNSGNFLSLKTSYLPDWFLISNTDNFNVEDQISIIPTWGMRRTIGKHFVYETGIGFGYRRIFVKNAGVSNGISEGALNVHLRIGYRF
ncbi:hypothetical protein ACFQ1M_03875 [Sungkyunkwania multivorans]|uniref:Outer membrane protein beta-barrel domain-containing protein n=1 Tax=Sungkyunkwania multivorans TaxID=1173618 RepID=A0ABW3CWV1_9FLAO